MSHTVTCKVEMRDTEALARAALRLGGEVLGEGQHGLYEGSERGFAVKLPDWLYPLVLTPSGLRYDNYKGRWGSEETLNQLTDAYAMEAARGEAERQGWYSEDLPDGAGLKIYHPDGGTITVGPGGTVDADCFEGRDCAVATAPIEAAMGRQATVNEKPEMRHERAHLTVGGE